MSFKSKAALALWLLPAFAAEAQENQPTIVPATIAPALPPTPPTTGSIPPPPTVRPGNRVVPIPTTMSPGYFTTIPSPPIPGTFSHVEQSSKRQSAQARVVLADGTKFEGEMFAEGSLQVVALFGGIALPLNQIRGIEWQAKSDQDDQGRKAKLVLVNDDSFTVTIPLPAIQLKTDWGHATVDLPKIQSIVLGSENYTWQDTPLGRELVPDGE